MPPVSTLALTALAGYLAGSIPTGVILGRVVGRDPRSAGSGNIGASNVTRTLGKKWGAVTLAIDLVKGYLPVYVPLALGLDLWAACLGGLTAVIGHCYPVWLKLAGGKGVATTFGAILALSPMIALLGALTWIPLVYITRIPAIGSLATAGLFVVLTGIVETIALPVHVFAIACAAVLVVRHHDNIKELRRRWQGKGRLATRRPRRRRRRPSDARRRARSRRR